MKRTDIETELRCRRNPSLLNFHKFVNQFNELISIEIWKSQSVGRSLEPKGIAPGSEESDLPFPISIGFHAFEALDTIM
jgi:hypothetical protein